MIFSTILIGHFNYGDFGFKVRQPIENPFDIAKWSIHHSWLPEILHIVLTAQTNKSWSDKIQNQLRWIFITAQHLCGNSLWHDLNLRTSDLNVSFQIWFTLFEGISFSYILVIFSRFITIGRWGSLLIVSRLQHGNVHWFAQHFFVGYPNGASIDPDRVAIL